MKKMYLLAFLGFSFFIQSAVYGQCDGRYSEEIFSSVTKETVVYTEDGSGFQMDIYEPEGDTLSERALIIMAHGGSFSAGDRTESDLVQLCTYFAKCGYVTASIDYTLTAFTNLADSLLMMDIVMKAVGDGKAAVRFFREDAATENTYRIDPDQIIFGGNSAGAILALHLAYLNDITEAPAFLQTIINANGGLEGTAGHAGYPSNVQGVINLAGGLYLPDMVGSNDADVFCVSAHGDADGVVPYDCNQVYWEQFGGLFDLVHLCGSSILHPVMEENNIPNSLWTLPGENHTPWSYEATLMDEVNVFVRDFLVDHIACEVVALPSGIAAASSDIISVSPNPASATDIRILYNAELNGKPYTIFNTMGQSVASGNLSEAELKAGHLRPGTYFLLIKGLTSPLTQKFVIF